MTLLEDWEEMDKAITAFKVLLLLEVSYFFLKLRLFKAYRFFASRAFELRDGKVIT